MKKRKHTRIRKLILNYLKKKQCLCFRRNIIAALVEKGLKKTNIILVMRKMRKEGKLNFARRRWGIK